MTKSQSVTFDGTKFISEYTIRDWSQKLNEELDEVKLSINDVYIYNPADKLDKLVDFDCEKIATKLQDLITVCTSMQQALGFDEEQRNQLCENVNMKNLQHNYFKERE